MIKIGLTGGIGSGKTTVAKIFESFGIPIYNSDDRAKYLMNNDVKLKQSIIELFGQEAYLDQALNRSFIASEVFTNPDKLKQLNQLVHPVVGKDFKNWCAKQKGSIIIKEAAILIESGAHKGLDKIVVVTAPESIRIKRVVNRDKVTEQHVRDRMKNQLTEKQRLEYADFIIDNGGGKSLIPQVQEIVKKLSYPKNM